MKKSFAVLLAITLVVLSAFSVSAAAHNSYGGLNGHFKSSRSDFDGKGGLSVEKTQLVSFDSPLVWENSNGRFNIKPESKIDTSDYKEGVGCFTTKLNGGTYDEDISKLVYEKHSVFGGAPGFDISVTDVNAQSIGFWLYVDDVNNLACDHDKVYNVHQQDCATLYFRIGQNEGNYQQWNHTFYGSGWQYIELAFATKENTPAAHRNKIKYDNMKYISLIVNTKGKQVNLKVDDISLLTYKTTAEKPVAPANGRWISACDYNVLGGETVTEWMGAYYDTKNKTQGSSSLALHGRKEHVDFRETIGGFKDFIINTRDDVFCFDLYIENLDTAGTDWTVAFYDVSDKENSAQANFSIINANVKDSKKLQEGWNTVQIPFRSMNKASFKNNQFKLHRLKIFVAGGSEKDYYNIAFDNMYIANAEDLGIMLDYKGSEESTQSNSGMEFSLSDEKIAGVVEKIASGELTNVSAYSKQDIEKFQKMLKEKYPDTEYIFNEDGSITVDNGNDLILYLCIGGGALLLIIIVVIIIVVVAKKKKKKKAAAVKAPAEPKTEQKPE
ncbi:MAG: hypothetical protein IJ462_03965 [Clostridia bacterium]|nr:hypothetical protein [Clostridia bacterium]